LPFKNAVGIVFKDTLSYINLFYTLSLTFFFLKIILLLISAEIHPFYSTSLTLNVLYLFLKRKKKSDLPAKAGELLWFPGSFTHSTSVELSLFAFYLL
jgi:hypothetical protein